MKKSLSLLLALLMLISVFAFAGCSGDEPKKTKENVKTEEKKTTKTSADPNSVLDHEVKDLHAHEFIFHVRNSSSSHLDTHEIFSDGISGDKISDAVFARNSKLEKDYNCTITQVKEVFAPTSSNREALVAGEYITDFFFDSAANTKTIMNTSLLADFRSLENAHLEKNWYDQGVVEGLTIDGRLFCVTGDAATLDDRACWIVYFNRDMVYDAMNASTSGLFDEYKDDEEKGFYQFILDGKWTADAMYEIMTLVQEDKDGNGVIDAENDILGYVGEKANNWFHVFSTGATISERTPDGDIVIPETLPDSILKAWTALKPVITSPFRYVSDSSTPFSSGHAVFFSTNLGEMLAYTNIGVNYGLAPMPKAKVEQDYYTFPSHQQLGVFSIPLTAEEAADAQSNGFVNGVEQAAYFLEAMGYYSIDTLTYAFYDQVISKQLIQDESSKTTLALALEHKVVDPVVLFLFGALHVPFQDAGSPMGEPSYGTDVAYDTLTSKYEERVGGARQEFQDWRDSLTIF